MLSGHPRVISFCQPSMAAVVTAPTQQGRIVVRTWVGPWFWPEKEPFLYPSWRASLTIYHPCSSLLFFPFLFSCFFSSRVFCNSLRSISARYNTSLLPLGESSARNWRGWLATWDCFLASPQLPIPREVAAASPAPPWLPLESTRLFSVGFWTPAHSSQPPR